MNLRESAAAYNKQKMSIAEYLDFENAAEEKHEYYQGDVFAMSGAKVIHNQIVVNTITAVRQSLTNKGCRPYNSDHRIYIGKNSLLLILIFLFSAMQLLRLTMMKSMQLIPQSLLKFYLPVQKTTTEEQNLNYTGTLLPYRNTFLLIQKLLMWRPTLLISMASGNCGNIKTLMNVL